MTVHPTSVSDEDLMDISSRFAYQNLDGFVTTGAELTINGKAFMVVSSVHDTVTGLDAYTFRNKISRELTIGFVGTSGAVDEQTDAQLITTMTPAQYDAAEAYVERVAGEFGPVGSVCGNSLGGGLAAYVAGHDASIRAVTVNPAPVPEGMAGADAPNVTNYVSSKTDLLNRAMVAGGMSDRRIGEVIELEGTRQGHLFSGENHIGSERQKGPYDASMGVPFSLFHQNTVVGLGGFGARVDVTTESFAFMSAGLSDQLDDLTLVIPENLADSRGALSDHLGALARSEALAKDAYRATLTEVLKPVYAGLEALQTGVDLLRQGIEQLSPPGPLRSAWNIAAPALTDPLSAILTAVREVVDLGIVAGAEVVWSVHQATLVTGTEAISTELVRQIGAVEVHVQLVSRKWEAVSRYAGDIGTTLASADGSVAAARSDPWQPFRTA